jgi:hypothetical protein
MKKISVIATVIMALVTLQLQAQEVSTEIQGSITPQQIGIAYNKTTNIIFPYAIKSVDRGSDEILIQVAREVENILQVKAAVDFFTPTNLTVITAEGALYSFMLYSDESPAVLNVHISPMEHRSRNVIFSKKEDHESRIRDFAERVSTYPPHELHILACVSGV